MRKTVLTLTVSKEWFSLIKEGVKDEEYRELNYYWINRLLLRKHDDDFERISQDEAKAMLLMSVTIKELLERKALTAIPYTHVIFSNGYRKDSPRIEKEIEGIIIGNPKDGLCPKEFMNKEYFIIKLKI